MTGTPYIVATVIDDSYLRRQRLRWHRIGGTVADMRAWRSWDHNPAMIDLWARVPPELVAPPYTSTAAAMDYALEARQAC